jgi:predicted dehydrogenase
MAVRVALFGNGFARSVILPCLRHVDGAEVVGIASPTLARVRETAREFGIEHVATDHRTILDRARPDLVFVVTPPHRHREQTVDALAAGCHVVCEKPTAMSAEESAAMLGAARAAHGRLALIDHELRFDPRRVALKALVDSGTLGRILHASYIVHGPSRRDPMQPWSWWSDRAQGGGAWGALGSHAVDALRVLVGEVAEAQGVLHTFVTERPDPGTGTSRAVTSDDFAEATLRFASGALASISLSLVEGARVHALTLAGSDGAVRLEEQGALTMQMGREPWKTVEVQDDLPPSSELGIPETDWARAFLRFAREIVAAIQDGRAEMPRAATAEDGHRNQVVLDAVRRSSETARWERIESDGYDASSSSAVRSGAARSFSQSRSPREA